MRNIFLLLTLLFFISCNDDVLPKPKAYLSLEYPAKKYEKLSISRPYSFDILKSTTIIDDKNNWLKIKYPNLKASIDITYRPVKNNLKELLTEAEKLVFKHAVKAEQIIPKDFVNTEKRTFGSLYEITGNAASHLQFHVTDSTNNFIKGSLYFYAKPNYDSILPAVAYIKEDILKLVESLEWEKPI
ncbi:gliding motility lipoprotein GldD [Polaribacter reichenbachii]|uniref:Gliding motility lipoprotein GldD n=1 Tax=Polaribacter reichenbachii TaxID=996801 RepID=A0A1B8U5Y8_9FLAO|nr:gliding motility lipoprotein GldD [Polaribacter reichenbachii]APZ46012.1 gliding motility lipoprotein GldD [Polaribacter reichenbachii]AUC19874.1 gliding motility lipoprotein GldD [Polaribacter reichenbachii]OBY67271.1 gliding motility lipoprotein GldD [Polaribacter reichenbachii]